MKIFKVINNNIVITLDQNNQKIILMGRGLGFKQRPGNNIDENLIEKRFSLSSSDNEESSVSQLLSNISLEDIRVATQILNYAKDIFNTKVSDSKVIALSDHIHSVLERYNSGVELKNNLLWEIKRFYPKEFTVGKEALDIIQQQFGIKLPEDEAGFITMHIVEAQMNQTIDDLDGLTQFIQKVIQILKYACHQEIDEHSAYYYRFVTHLRYLAQRIFSNQISIEKTDSSMLEIIKLQYPDAYQAAEKVLNFIQNEYNCRLASDELIYLTIHIEKLIRHTNTD
ncbi:PRD domain-containing protein (plasmid) [Ligilactobacillus salivarius]|uniref:BglG family transcription antiterminator LicT n=1 Tax=Ligilactobacillus salivarius TaxID=1624 RepID=UPI0015DFF74C|nr:PRD domain-containing protein [Ligilactobacillus salivarius]QLL72703.1 PRD domain-containing protein [Ligilactobacillus salivarius]